MNQATADVIIGIAQGELNYTEDPPNSNRNKYAQEIAPAANGQAWCAIFVSWVFEKADLPLPKLQSAISSGFAYCPYAVNYARQHGQTVPFEEAQPGDIALFDWDRNNGAADHVGIVESGQALGVITTLEGNTSLSNQSNGGAVMRRYRHREDVQEIWRPPVADIVLPASQPLLIPVNQALEVDDVKIVNQLIHVTHIGYGFGRGEADFGQPVSAVVGAVINGPDPKDLSDSWWEESKLANAARAQVSGNKVIVTVSGLAGDCDVYVTAVAA